MRFDIIGDIHGQADKLEALLRPLVAYQFDGEPDLLPGRFVWVD